VGIKKAKKSAATSRRDFIKRSSLWVTGGAVAGGLNVTRAAHAYGSDEIKVGLVGCGGRGSDAAVQALNTATKEDTKPNGPVKLIAMADVFADKVHSAYRKIKGRHRDLVDVPRERRFTGFDAYQKVLDCDIDVVILATPPGFRPLHFEAAVYAGRHVFMEKPCATDAPGVRRLLTANETAKDKGLMVAVGLQRRHETKYRETIARLQDGAIGDIVCTRVFWNGAGVPVYPRRKGQTELEYQMRNWYYFNWLCGDHIVERHIHNLDVSNWLMGGPPVECNGMGGRQVRTGKEHGQIYDHHFCEYTYASGTRMYSQCRRIRGCWNNVSEHVHGTRGRADISGAKIYDASGQLVWKYGPGGGGGHQQEHCDLFVALRRGDIYNEGDYGATSNMTAILGRLATYSGKIITWDDATKSDIALADVDSLRSFEDEPPLKPGKDGYYQIAMPGQTETIC
jgi:predicted dehydrogenase